MRYGGEDRDILIQKRVRLVQRGHFKYNIEELEDKDITGIDSIIGFDYMGAVEFECGALPRSLRRMTLNKDFYKVFVFNEYKDKNGNSLKVYAPEVFLKNVKNIVDKLVLDDLGLEERCTLYEHVVNENQGIKRPITNNNNFWWDIENDFFMFFEHTDKLLIAMEALRKRKFGYDKNIPKKAFNKFYLEVLSKMNLYSLTDWNTSIKDYFFDETSKIHFIEFLENAELNDILMEAMVISKVDKGIVRFCINGVNFEINEDMILDKVVDEKGIQLVDVCTYSEKIEELIYSYNEEVALKQKQQELVHVMRLVRDKKFRENN